MTPHARSGWTGARSYGKAVLEQHELIGEGVNVS